MGRRGRRDKKGDWPSSAQGTMLPTMLRRGLYALVDVEATQRAGFDIIPLVERILLARPAALQLRAKTLDARQTLIWLEKLRPLARAKEVPLFANDRPDLALVTGCDGVHVGQTDLPLLEIRRHMPQLRVGISTNTLEQLALALDQGADYVAFGPVFSTPTKPDADPAVGLPLLQEAGEVARMRGVPLVAIGGIDLERAPEIGAMAWCGAAISALLPRDGSLAQVTENAVRLHRALGG